VPQPQVEQPVEPVVEPVVELTAPPAEEVRATAEAPVTETVAVAPIVEEPKSETEFNPDNFETSHPEVEAAPVQESPEVESLPVQESAVPEASAEVVAAPATDTPATNPAQAPQPEINKSGRGKKIGLIVLGVIMSLIIAAGVAFALMTFVFDDDDKYSTLKEFTVTYDAPSKKTIL